MNTINTRFFHGNLKPIDVANAIDAHFNRGNFIVEQIGEVDELIIQITTTNRLQSGGHTSVAVHITQIEDGIAIQIGKQSLFGVAASLGKTALMTWRNPLSLLSRLDDLAQDFESIRLSDEIWDVIESTADYLNANYKLSQRLSRTVCPYCKTANPFGAPNCIACGAPLGQMLPNTCSNCGFVVLNDIRVCPNCGNDILTT